MSAGDNGNLQDNSCQKGSVVFFSNPLMSDHESDWSPIHDAAFNGRVLTLQNLIAQGTCVNLATLDRVSALHGACVQGHTACAKLLIERGANVNTPTLDRKSPLSEACARGHLACVSLLLQHGASPLGTGQSHSPIHRAAAGGHTECIETLVEHGADVDQHIDQSGSPLYTACTNQHVNTVRKLLQLGASVNSSVGGDSPLHVAARLSSPELVSVLLDHGADPALRNSGGKQPLDLSPPNSLVERVLGRTGGWCQQQYLILKTSLCHNARSFLDAWPEVSRLMQLCRLHIRKIVGKERLGDIHGLHVPLELKQYLLYQSDPWGRPIG